MNTHSLERCDMRYPRENGLKNFQESPPIGGWLRMDLLSEFAGLRTLLSLRGRTERLELG